MINKDFLDFSGLSIFFNKLKTIGLMSSTDKAKLQGIEEKANNYTHPDTHPATMIDQDADHRFVSDHEKQEWGEAYAQATAYTDQQIADLINGAPETLDTLGEIAKAMQDNKDVVQALDQAIGTKASQAELDGHTGNSTIHITASERQAWNDKQTKTGDTKDNTVTFTSGDSANPTEWADIGVIRSGEKHGSLFCKMSLAIKNLRYLWQLLGTTSLAGIGDGTVTGAISQLNTGLGVKRQIIINKPIKFTTDEMPVNGFYIGAVDSVKKFVSLVKNGSFLVRIMI